MKLNVLIEEVTTDPLGRGYSSMSDEQVATDLNTVYRTIPKPYMSGDEIFSATDSGEFTGLSDHKRELWVSFTSKDFLDPYSQTNIAFLDYIFGTGSTTKATLASLRENPVSRAVELDLGIVRTGDIEFIRR